MSNEQTKDDPAQDGNGLVSFSRRALTRDSTNLVRRGLADLLNIQSALDYSGGLRNPHKELERVTPEQTPSSSIYDPWTRLSELAEELMSPDHVENSLGIELNLIRPGRFMMGSAAKDNEKPIHEVTISKSFYMGIHPVTQSQWQEIMGDCPCKFIGDDYPVHAVSWDDVQEFIRKLNFRDLQSKTHFFYETTRDATWPTTLFKYRLPSEAEWEYACRAGTTGDFAGILDSMAWYANNSGPHYLDAAHILKKDGNNYVKLLNDNGNQMHPVGTKEANAFGLYDMHGNVWDWCQDWYHGTYYGAPTDGSAWLSGGEQEFRVLRGGSWFYPASSARSAFRNKNLPENRSRNIGFRLVANVDFVN